MRHELEALEEVLARHAEVEFAGLVREALAGPEEVLRAFLTSNELWGGPGSIADQAGCSLDRAAKTEIYSALIDLGNAQLREGLSNVRTSGWVDAFTSWRRAGL